MTWPIPIGTRGEDVNPPGAFPLWLGTFGDEIFGCGVERDDRVQGIDTEALDGSNVHEAAIDSHIRISSVTYRTHLREYSLMTYHHIASGLGGFSAGSKGSVTRWIRLCRSKRESNAPREVKVKRRST